VQNSAHQSIPAKETEMDNQGVNDFLYSISRGFIQSPAHIRLFFILIAVFLAVILLVAFLQRRRARLRQMRNAAEMYEHLVRQLGLSRSERELADRLSGCCQPPEKKYLVLLHQHTFDACAAKLREREAIAEMTLAALRLKLDFTAHRPEDVPASSTELPRGMRVVLAEKGRAGMKGRVTRQDPEALVVTMEGGSALPSRGVPLSVYFHNRAGLFAFLTHAHRITGRDVFLDHSEAVKRSQRRRYYRRRIQIAVEVAPEDQSDEALPAVLADLSGGGASLQNPGLAAEPGSRLRLTFAPRGARLSVTGRVMRTSAGGRLLHLQFEGLSEAARDRVIGLVFGGRSRP
jgi:hypothetical protein